MAAATIITSVITGGSNSHQTVAEELNAYATDFVKQGVWGTITLGFGSTPGVGSFAVSQDTGTDLAIDIAAGVAYVAGTPSGQDAQVVRARMTSNYTSYTINSNNSGAAKFDWIYLQFNATNAATPDLAADNVVNIYTSRSTSNISDNGAPPTFGILLAVISIANGATSVINNNISDRRTAAFINYTNSVGTTGWNSIGYALTYGTNNGNKEFTVTSPNNLTGILSTGMKLSINRSVTPPTECMSFIAASSQYASKSSPTGITFTSAFTCETWIKLNSYTGQIQYFGGRTDNSTGGFAFGCTAAGQLYILYGASSSFTTFTSYQSLPINRWIHVAVSVSSVSSKTAIMYINGTSVPFATGGSATTLTQTGNLFVSGSVTNTYLDGEASEFRIWSAAQSQANIQANMAISLTGSETNLVALFQGNGNFNDKTSNANNLTASGGALATQVSNPYNSTEYAIITKVTYSNPTTTLTLSTGDFGTIPNQTLNTPQYSTSENPYGLPNDLHSGVGRRLIYVPVNASQTAVATSRAQFNPITNLTFTVPGNCSKLKICAFATNAANSGGISVYEWYNGSISTTNSVGQYNINTGNFGMSASIPVSVVPGSTFTLNMTFYTTSGTVSWAVPGNPTGPSEDAVWVETA